MTGKAIAFIGDADSVLGFRALGVDSIVPESAEDAVASFRALVKEKVSVIMIVEDLLDILEDEITALADEPLPAVVILPGISGGEERGAKIIRKLVTRAVGIDLMALDES